MSKTGQFSSKSPYICQKLLIILYFNAHLNGFFLCRVFYMSLRFIYIVIFALLGIMQTSATYKRQFFFMPSNYKSEITHIAADDLGYIWISTDEGLVRYDGFSYLRIEHRQGDTLSLPNNGCKKVLIDSRKNFWVGTSTGLALFDPRTYVCHYVPVDSGEVAIIDLEEDADHTLWLLSYDAIYHFYPETKKVEAFRGDWGIRFAVTDTELWVTSETKGLTVIDKKTGKAEKVGGLSNDLFRVFKTSTGKMFLGSLNNGLYILNQDRKVVKHYLAKKDGALFSSNCICSFAEDEKGNVWVGNLNGNLTIYNLNTMSFVPSRLIFPEGVNDNHLTVSSILCDASNNIWVGTYRYWFYKSSASHQVFTYHRLSDGSPVSSFLYRQGKPLLVASDGGGIFTFDAEKNYSLQQAFTNNKDLCAASIRKTESGNEAYIASWGSGIFKTEANSLKPVFNNRLPSFKLQDVLPTDSGMWVAIDEYGVLFLKNNGRILGRGFPNSAAFSSMPHYPHHLFVGRNGNLWISTSNGLCVWNGVKLRKYFVPEANSNDDIMAVEDMKKRVWFLNKTHGLCCLDTQTDSIAFFSQRYGLPIGLKALAVDHKGYLWITSSDHLYCIDLETEDIRNFDISSQLGIDVFHPRSLTVCPDGMLYAGSSSGFLAVQTNDILPPVEKSVVLSSFSLFGEVQKPGESDILTEDISLCGKLELSHVQNLFSFSFVCPNYSGPDQIEFYYRLTGLSKSWVKADGHSASFSSLPAGTYKLEVKAMAGNHLLGTLAKPFTLVVRPAWWNTWWFRTLLLLLVTGVVFLFVSYRIRFLKQQQLVLEQQVASRTRQLADRNEEILKQNKDIESKNAELDNALSTKDKIISVMAHDLRNPLSVITGMLGLLQSNNEVSKSPVLAKQIDTASNAANILQGQMENLLQWARLRSSSIVFSPTEVFLAYAVKGAITLLQDVARQKGVCIEVNDSSTHAAIADERMVATIVRNLLANAIKFSYANAKVEVEISETDDLVLLKVRDHGMGIAPELLDSLFADSKAKSLASTNGTAGEEGSGLGLRICYDFATRCKGNLSVESTEGLGSVFTLALPKCALEKSAEKQTDVVGEAVPDNLEQPVVPVKEEAEKKSILFVDDDANLLGYLTAIFQGEFVVETASNGEEGLQAARKSLPDIIISDLMMPRMNGKEFCEQIKKDSLTRHIPVLLLTASDSDVTHVESLTVGADDYILKPFHRDILIAKVKSVLHNKELQMQYFREQVFAIKPDEVATSSPEAEFINKATQVVKEHVADSDFTAEVFASELAISRVQLFRKFKAVMATSPSDFVRQYRLVYAEQLLAAGNSSVADVAYACGFSDPKYFSSCFSARYGVSPSQYAKNK